MNVEQKLIKLYDILEQATAFIFVKKKEFIENEEEEKNEKNKKKAKNKIPKEIRLLMRQKKDISQRILKSNHWLKTLRLTKDLAEKESLLTQHYKKRKLKVENEALAKIKSDPKYFYTFARKSAKTMNSIGTLLGADGKLCSEDYEKAECLRKQYESVYTEPDQKFLIGDAKDFFGFTCEQCKAQVTHECIEDQVHDEAYRTHLPYRTNTPDFGQLDEGEEAIRRRNPPNPQLTDIYFNHMDVMEAINKIPNGSSP